MSTEAGSLARSHERSAARALASCRSGPQRPLTALRALRHARDSIDAAIGFWADAARLDGHSWAAIGRELDVTGQAVRQAALRRREHQAQRADAAQWRLPLSIRLPRISWRIGRRAA